MPAVLVVAGMTSQGCSQVVRHMAERVLGEAANAVRSEIDSPERWDIRELRTAGNNWGEGIFVYAVDQTGDPAFVWLFSRNSQKVYALGTEELRLTPHVQLLEEAPGGVRNTVALARVSRAEIQSYLGSLKNGAGYLAHRIPN